MHQVEEVVDQLTFETWHQLEEEELLCLEEEEQILPVEEAEVLAYCLVAVEQILFLLVAYS